MNLLQVLVVIATTVAVSAGVVFTFRGFKASARPAGAAKGGDGDIARAANSPHDPATMERLKRFFDGRECAICRRPIPPVQRTGMKPGMLDPATHQAYSWDEVPQARVAEGLDSLLPLCASCRVAESFRSRFPDRVVDREDRITAG
jgi:hypothetical protein